MVVDQAELDKMREQAKGDADPASPAAAPALAPAQLDLSEVSDDVRRMLRLHVPVIVQLARRKLAIRAARKLSIGTILEFNKAVSGPLDLLINNQHVGRGDAVKVGEHFGLRVSEIDTAANRIRALGK